MLGDVWRERGFPHGKLLTPGSAIIERPPLGLNTSEDHPAHKLPSGGLHSEGWGASRSM